MEVAVMGPKQLPRMTWKFWGFVFSSDSDHWWCIDIIAAGKWKSAEHICLSILWGSGCSNSLCVVFEGEEEDVTCGAGRRAIGCLCGPHFNIRRTVSDEVSNCNHTNPLRVTQKPLDRFEWKFYSWSNLDTFGIWTQNMCSDYEFCVLLQ